MMLLSGPEFQLVERLIKSIDRLAVATENEQKKRINMLYNADLTFLVSRFTKENIIKYASEEELFALFHTFKEYYNAVLDLPKEFGFRQGYDCNFTPTDKQIGEVIKQLKQKYK